MITSVITLDNRKVVRKLSIVECTNKMNLLFRLHTITALNINLEPKGKG